MKYLFSILLIAAFAIKQFAVPAACFYDEAAGGEQCDGKEPVSEKEKDLQYCCGFGHAAAVHPVTAVSFHPAVNDRITSPLHHADVPTPPPVRCNSVFMYL